MGSDGSLSGLLSTVSTVLTSGIDWMGMIGSAITSNALLLLGVVLSFAGFGVGLFRRLLHV